MPRSFQTKENPTSTVTSSVKAGDHQCEYISTDVFMDIEMYLAAKSGIDYFLQVLDQISLESHASYENILDRVSHAGNTVAHVAARHGNIDIICHIATNFSYLIFQKNSAGDTVLHIASRNGYLSIVKALLPELGELQNSPSRADYIAAMNNLSRKKNKRGNTALHEALSNGQELVALYLIQQDPELSYYQNKEGETGFYLAAKAGYAKCISSMLEDVAVDQDLINQLFKEKSPIKVAIFNNNRGVLEAMLNSKPCLNHLRDGEGSTPLHYAVSAGFIEMVHYLLKKYPPNITQRDNKGLCPIHLASVKGHVNIIKLLHQYHPAPAELLDGYGCNILHLAARNGRYNVFKYVLHKHEFEELINMKDVDGNTPLHLATMAWYPKIVSALTWDTRVDLKLVNEEGMTALDAADWRIGENPQFRRRLTWIALKSAGAPRDISGKFVTKQNNARSNKETINILLLVATLVATVTYAAGFTLPGGINSAGADTGRATMVTQREFHVFVLCDTIAMYCSIITAVALIFAQLGDLNLMDTVLHCALPSLGIALFMMSMAFGAGVFLVVTKVRWLTITVLVIGISFTAILLSLLFLLCIPLSSSNRILGYLSYYPYRLTIIATNS